MTPSVSAGELVIIVTTVTSGLVTIINAVASAIARTRDKFEQERAIEKLEVIHTNTNGALEASRAASQIIENRLSVEIFELQQKLDAAIAQRRAGDTKIN
jgi:hypothetical protein